MTIVEQVATAAELERLPDDGFSLRISMWGVAQDGTCRQ